MKVSTNIYSINSVEKYLAIAAIFAMIFLPVIWGIGFSYKLYGEHPWPGVAVYAHFGLLALFFLFFINYKKIIQVEILYFSLFFAYFFFSVAISLLFFVFSSLPYKTEAVMQSLISSFYIFAYCIAGYFLFKFKWPRLILLSLLLVFLLVSITEYNHGSTIPVSLYTIYGSVSEVIPNYQIISLSVLFLGLLILNSSLNFNKSLFLVCLVMVFLTGGRSEFLGGLISFVFIFSLVLVVVLLKRFSIKKSQSKFLIAFLIALSLLFVYVGNKPEILNNRNFQVTDLDKASSWQAREKIKETNQKYIYGSPIVGEFGSYFSMGEGSYTHNWLSVWQQYGFFMFLLYVFFMTYPVIRLAYFYFKYEDKSILMPLSLCFYCLLLVMVSKSFIWSYAGLSVGAYLYTVRELNYKNRRLGLI